MARSSILVIGILIALACPLACGGRSVAPDTTRDASIEGGSGGTSGDGGSAGTSAQGGSAGQAGTGQGGDAGQGGSGAGQGGAGGSAGQSGAGSGGTSGGAGGSAGQSGADSGGTSGGASGSAGQSGAGSGGTSGGASGSAGLGGAAGTAGQGGTTGTPDGANCAPSRDAGAGTILDAAPPGTFPCWSSVYCLVGSEYCAVASINGSTRAGPVCRPFPSGCSTCECLLADALSCVFYPVGRTCEVRNTRCLDSTTLPATLGPTVLCQN